MATIFLATVIGWYMVIISLFLLLRHEQVKSIVSDVVAQQGVFFMMTIITIILGLLMVTSHNVWVTGWPVVVTLISWLVLSTGILRLVCAESAKKMASSFVEHSTSLRIAGVIILVIGLFLLFKVYYPM